MRGEGDEAQNDQEENHDEVPSVCVDVTQGVGLSSLSAGFSELLPKEIQPLVFRLTDTVARAGVNGDVGETEDRWWFGLPVPKRKERG